MGREGGKVTVGCASMVLTYEHFSERIGALYVDLRQSAAEQAQFITNPARMISERIFDGRKLDAPETSERANLVLCALLGNSHNLRASQSCVMCITRKFRVPQMDRGI